MKREKEKPLKFGFCFNCDEHRILNENNLCSECTEQKDQKEYSEKEGLAETVLNELAKTHNDFKTVQDRKYTVYTIFRYHNTPFKVEKMVGSNQVLLYDNEDKTIYDSANETIEQQITFREWLRRQIIVLLLCILPEGLNDTIGT